VSGLAYMKFIDPAVAGIGADYLWSNHNWRLLALLLYVERLVFQRHCWGSQLLPTNVKSVDRIESILCYTQSPRLK